ncbi:hypothetical protein [Phenylobacterium sp.]|uniref:hypothetical protein n=1 Tax=Phenylobacterium sp. TaxID=1871053 RepID=UPI0025D7319A|nr:hypothetical protein [Phenylobacterium sp.]
MTVKKSGDGDETPTPGSDPTTVAAEAAPDTPDEFRTFMVALATDPARLGAYIKDPDTAMQAAGIGEVDRAILKGGQPWAIHARLMGQRFSFDPPPTPAAVLVVDMVRPPGAPEGAAADQPTVRGPQPAFGPGSSSMFPNAPPQFPQFPQFPQVHPQVVVHPQIFPQVHPQIFPQIHPQIVHPQVVVHPQIFPQIFPQVHPQIFPQIFPQVHPQIFPQVFPQIHPLVTPGPQQPG